MNPFITITTLIALSLFLNNQQTQSSWEQRAVADTQRALASELDGDLPGLSFANWFEKVVGSGTGVIWQLSECEERVEPTSDGTGDIRACVEVNTILPDGRRVIVMITVGTFKKGVTGAPAFYFGVIERKGELYQVRRLRDLPKLLSAPGSLANNSAVKLPDVNIPEVRLTANNTYADSGPVWSWEEPGRPRPIEESPLRADVAPSNATVTAERRNPPGEVLQGAPIFKSQPKYPQSARRFNASGRVEVRVTVSSTGRVIKATAISGHPLLRDAAVEAARRWEFEPTLVDGAPAETELVLTFDFAAPPPP